jgi:Periplasmic protease
VRRPVRVTRADTAIVVGLAIFAGLAAILIHGSSRMISPARPRVSESSRPSVGLTLEEAREEGLVVERATGPAERAGLRAGDRIVRLDGEPARPPANSRGKSRRLPRGRASRSRRGVPARTGSRTASSSTCASRSRPSLPPISGSRSSPSPSRTVTV